MVLTKEAKKPLVKSGFKAATTDARQIERRWKRWPDASIGIWPAPSGLLVFDLDGKEAERFADEQGLLGTRTVLTGRGSHLYFKHPGFRVSNLILAPGLDVRADAGCIVVPPSIHPLGEPYRWHDGDAPIQDIPPHVVQLLRAPPQASAAVEEGGRNNHLTRVLGAMRRVGVEEEALLEVALVLNEHECDPPLPEREVRKIARGTARRYAPEASNDIITQLNATHGIIQVGRVYVLQERGGAGNFALLSPADFKLLHARLTYFDGQRERRAADAWLTAPERREYPGGIVFDPHRRDVPGAFNVWGGWAVEPAAGGDCSRFLAHVRENVCRGDEALYRWVMVWFAAIFQQPTQEAGTALVMRHVV